MKNFAFTFASVVAVKKKCSWAFSAGIFCSSLFAGCQSEGEICLAKWLNVGLFLPADVCCTNAGSRS